MTHRSTDSLDERTAWSVDESDESVEFAAVDSPVADDAPAEESRPAWFRGRDDPTETEAADADQDESADLEFASADPVEDDLDDSAADEADESDLDVSETPARRPLPEVKRRGTSRRRRDPNAPRIKVAKEGEPDRTLVGMLLQPFNDGTAGSFGVSLAVHLVIALILGYIVKESLEENEAISMTITESNSVPIDFEEIEDVSVDLAGGEELQVPQFQNVPLAVDTMLTTDIAAMTKMQGAGEGDGGDIGSGFKFRMPEGGKAVSAGSFTAWTVPEDPKPGQDYMIVIRVKVPDGVRTYRVSDLSGQIVGTDGYVLNVPIDSNPSRSDRTKTERAGRLVPVKSRDRLRVVKGHVQLMVDVPGAASLTRDSIQLKSKMLKEEQKLEIVF